MKKKVTEAECISVLTDGWTDINGISLINIILTTPKPIFYKAIDPETEKHSADYIFKILNQTIQEVGEQKVFALCTDNAANMKAAWTKIRDKYPHIIFNTFLMPFFNFTQLKLLPSCSAYPKYTIN